LAGVVFGQRRPSFKESKTADKSYNVFQKNLLSVPRNAAAGPGWKAGRTIGYLWKAADARISNVWIPTDGSG
jgi:hypothetical protein